MIFYWSEKIKGPRNVGVDEDRGGFESAVIGLSRGDDKVIFRYTMAESHHRPSIYFGMIVTIEIETAG
jgi:hypothetical protein